MANICVDPGHSGNPDPGAMGPSGVREADVVMNVCNKLTWLLQADKHSVTLTRQGDDPDSDNLNNRVAMANNINADLFVSIHANGFVSPDAHGVETYTYTKCSEHATRLAGLVQAELVNSLGLADRGVRTANYYVLRETDMPAILVELAFITNPTEEDLLNNDTFQMRCAVAIYAGIYKYFS